MSQLRFSLIETSPSPGCQEIQIEGELDLAVAGRLREALERAGKEHDRVVIGMQGCEFVDSTGISVIVEAQRKMAERGGLLAMHGISGQVQRTFDITGLTRNGIIFESAEAARAADRAD